MQLPAGALPKSSIQVRAPVHSGVKGGNQPSLCAVSTRSCSAIASSMTSCLAVPIGSNSPLNEVKTLTNCL